VTIARSAAELLARASWRERVVPADARSGAVFERVVVAPTAPSRQMRDRKILAVIDLRHADRLVRRPLGARVSRPGAHRRMR
jgi:hypothetical protein